MGQDPKAPAQRSGFLGTLKDALAAASREDTDGLKARAKAEPEEATEAAAPIQLPPPLPKEPEPAAAVAEEASDVSEVEEADAVPRTSGLSAADAAREARRANTVEPVTASVEKTLDTARVTNAMVSKTEDEARTQLVRGKVQVARGQFDCDPVVGWLVIVGGPGIGAYRPVFEGNNSIGRSLTQRIPIDFGDDAISSEEQAYIRYDSSDRSFLFVPNLAKTNVVSINNARPTGAVELSAMDVIVMGRTQLVFVPFCGSDFDWSEIAENKG